ncbi:MAG: hypothetical protein KKD77_22135, partial [Gammaproteobacteria bacterium]|nr:hypothetical protein [Gammaproteobacteria bacterium]
MKPADLEAIRKRQEGVNGISYLDIPEHIVYSAQDIAALLAWVKKLEAAREPGRRLLAAAFLMEKATSAEEKERWWEAFR